MTNALITQAKAKIDQAVKPEQKQDVDKIVLAGMKIMYSKQMHDQLLQSLKAAPDAERVNTVAEGIIGLLGMMFKESRNTMPVIPMILAGQELLLEALDFLEQLKMVQVTNESLAAATQHYLETLLPKLGMTPEKMANILGHTKKIIDNPQQMAEFKKAQGAQP